MTDSNRAESETAPQPDMAAAAGNCPTDPKTAEKLGFRRGLISAFLLFQLVAIVCWAWPFSVPVMQDVKELTRPYLLWTGLFQSWDFFAPNPKSTNSFVEAVVITRDRHQLIWAFPAMERLSYFERYREERYRKFTEALPDPKNAPLWPRIAQRIAQKFQNPADPPQVVLLINVSAPIAPGASAAPTPHVFYEYEVALPDGETP
jgi:hypothetical protein